MKVQTPSLDGHCHLDRYGNPSEIAAEARRRGVFILAVTNLPSHFRLGLGHVQDLRNVRLALGLHPLAAEQHEGELKDFHALLSQTSYVGEVGLDFSRHGKATARMQVENFRSIIEGVSITPKIVSIHSRNAAPEVLAILDEYRVPPVIFHWYTDHIDLIARIVSKGHYFSVNPAMTTSASGRDIIRGIPIDRIIAETDGPYAKAGKAAAKPWDVAVVERYLSQVHQRTPEEVHRLLWENFQRVLQVVGVGRGSAEIGGAHVL